MATCRFAHDHPDACTAPATVRAGWAPWWRDKLAAKDDVPLMWCEDHAALLRDLARPGKRNMTIRVGNEAQKVARESARLPRSERLARVVAWARSTARPITRAEAATASGLAESAMSPVLRLGVENGSLRRERGKYAAA